MFAVFIRWVDARKENVYDSFASNSTESLTTFENLELLAIKNSLSLVFQMIEMGMSATFICIIE